MIQVLLYNFKQHVAVATINKKDGYYYVTKTT
jgi:hypothetical protein